MRKRLSYENPLGQVMERFIVENSDFFGIENAS